VHNEELHISHSLPDIVRVIRSRRMILVENLVCVGEIGNAYEILVE